MNQFSDNQFEAWQTSLGFVSAEKYLEPVFQEYDNLQSEQELDDFVDNYKDQLFIGKDEDGNYTVDYPYCNMLWLRLMNKDGVFKIGDILHSYERNYIAVLDGDLNKLKIAKQNPEKYAGMQSKDKVYIEQYSNLKSDFYNEYYYKHTYDTGWEDYLIMPKEGDYRLTVRLECISRWVDGELVALPYIWVKGEKKRSFGNGYKRFKTKYEISNFRARIYYPERQQYNTNVIHRIYDYMSYETSDDKRYGSFVFDEYSNQYDELNVMPYSFNIAFNIGSSEISATYLNKSDPGSISGDFPDGYPEWHINN